MNNAKAAFELYGVLDVFIFPIYCVSLLAGGSVVNPFKIDLLLIEMQHAGRHIDNPDLKVSVEDENCARSSVVSCGHNCARTQLPIRR